MRRDDVSPSDAELIAATIAGDREGFAGIVRRYQRPLIHVAQSRLGRVELAEEVVQETFVSVFKSIRTYDSRYSFRTWLWTILLNQCRQKYKKLKRSPHVQSWSDGENDSLLDQSLRQAESNAGPVQRAMRREEDRHLHLLLTELPEGQADALRLRFFGGLKFQEIADTMNCSLSSAKNRVKIGLIKLANRMEGDSPDVDNPSARNCEGEPKR